MPHPKITEQIELMKLALSIQDDIETLERIIKPVDEITFKVIKDTLRGNYLDVMQRLFSNLLILSDGVQQ